MVYEISKEPTKLIPRLAFIQRDYGRFFIPSHKLDGMSPVETDREDAVLQEVSEAYPEIAFEVQREFLGMGVTLHWRRK